MSIIRADSKLIWQGVALGGSHLAVSECPDDLHKKFHTCQCSIQLNFPFTMTKVDISIKYT